ncbi:MULTISPECIES: hypothetical protein [unclassified Microbacterium]|uniref:hypothetical protein n=1 Tax=unclassified Microbacterium TaxID=2609290 RepID=UPI003868B257
MPVPPAPLPAALGTSFSCAAARAAGVSRGRLTARDLDAPFRGARIVRCDIPPLTDDEPHNRRARDELRQRLAAYLPVMPRNAFVTGATAAVCFELPLARVPTSLDIAVPAPHRAPRRTGIRGRKLEPHLTETTRLHPDGGFDITTPATTWATLARDADVPELVRLGDAIVRVPRDRRGVPTPQQRLATVDDLREVLARGRWLGAARLRRALALVRVGSMSPLETDMRLALLAEGLPEPQLDVEIRAADGRLLGIADAAYRDARVLIEVEGDHHRTIRAQWLRDIEKHEDYAHAGWRVVRLTSGHIRGARPHAGALVRRAWKG